MFGWFLLIKKFVGMETGVFKFFDYYIRLSNPELLFGNLVVTETDGFIVTNINDLGITRVWEDDICHNVLFINESIEDICRIFNVDLFYFLDWFNKEHLNRTINYEITMIV